MTIREPILSYKRKLFFCVLLLSSLTTLANEKAHITIKVAEGVTPTELVISKIGEDSANSPYKTSLEKGIHELDIETDFIELYQITDWTQLMANKRTKRFTEFLIEDGADITLTLYDDRIEAVSTGPEHLAKEQMEALKTYTFMPRAKEIENTEDAKVAEKMHEQLSEEVSQWERDYYARNPMISFILDLNASLAGFNFEDHELIKQLQLYHEYYSDKYPGHPVHQSIAKNETSGLQIYGGPYHDYDVTTLDGEKVRAYDFVKPGYNLVICWATWCASCRKECQEIAAFINPYIEKGLNVFALTREFKSIDTLRNIVDKDRHPWPTLVDLDDEFHVFDIHGATSSAVFIINPEGKIIFSDIGPDKVKEALDVCL